MPHEPDEARALLRLLRAHHTASLLSHDHERSTPLRLVLDPASGALIAPVSAELLASPDFVLLLPEEGDERVQASAQPTLIPDPSADPAVDRHAAYHGPTSRGRWCRWTILSAKGRDHTGALAAMGEELMQPSPLAGVEPALVRAANADTDALRALTLRLAGVRIDQPVAVGVDPDGIDVRAKFGIVRASFVHPLEEPSRAADTLRDLLAGKDPAS